MVMYFFIGVLYMSLGISFYYLYLDLDVDNRSTIWWYRPIVLKEWFTYTIYVYLVIMVGIVSFIIGILLMIGFILIWPLIAISYIVRMKNGNIIRFK